MADDDLQAGEPLERLPAPRRRHGGLVVTVAILVIFGVVVWYVYQRMAQPGSSSAPPLIKAEQGPVKVPPENPGGLQVPNQDKAIYDRIGNTGGKNEPVEKLLPPPEAPKPEMPVAPKPSEAPPASAPAVATPSVLPPATAPSSATTAAAVPPPSPSALDKPAVTATTPPASPAPAPATTPSAPAKTAQAQPPSTKPDASPTAAQPSAAKPAAATPPVAKSTAPAAPAKSGAARVQLGAFRQVSEAEQSWQQLQKKYADMLSGLSPTIVRADLGEKGIYQRLQAGPLPDRAAAAALCEKLKLHNQGCLVVAP